MMNSNEEQKRRRNDTSTFKTNKRHKVHPHVTFNRKMDADMRMENIEHDVVFNTQILYEVLETNQRYSVYLETRIKHEEDAAEFWGDVRKKLVTAGLFSVIGLIFTALSYAFKEYLHKI